MTHAFDQAFEGWFYKAPDAPWSKVDYIYITLYCTLVIGHALRVI